MEHIEYFVIERESEYYKQAIQMRYRIFFESSNVSIDAVYDDIENDSIHFAAVKGECVVGYIRLTIQGNRGLVSQFVVTESERGTALIGKRLIEIVEKRAREEKMNCIYGEIRLHVAKAAKCIGFKVSDEIIYSKKTGLPHKRIEKILKYD